MAQQLTELTVLADNAVSILDSIPGSLQPPCSSFLRDPNTPFCLQQH